jgi:drug/metabolite transporter (DMT)-like permease
MSEATTTRRTAGRAGMNGVLVAGITAVISGISVFANSYEVQHVPSASVYTSGKNLVAFLVLGAGALVASTWRRRSPMGGQMATRWVTAAARFAPGTRSTLTWLGLAYVGIIGGGLAFVLFFNGLARTAATPAAFLHDTLVIWVVLLAGPFLHERAARWNIAAMALLVGGEVALSKGIGHLAWGSGAALVLAATLLWAVEVVVAKKLLVGIAPATVSLVRMGVGSAALLAYLAVDGSLGSLFALNRGQLGWILFTGLLLAGYVGTWMTALSRARAIDVTSILVVSVLITAALQALAGTQPLAPEWLGLMLIAAGTALVAWRMPRRAIAT